MLTSNNSLRKRQYLYQIVLKESTQCLYQIVPKENSQC